MLLSIDLPNMIRYDMRFKRIDLWNRSIYIMIPTCIFAVAIIIKPHYFSIFSFKLITFCVHVWPTIQVTKLSKIIFKLIFKFNLILVDSGYLNSKSFRYFLKNNFLQKWNSSKYCFQSWHTWRQFEIDS